MVTLNECKNCYNILKNKYNIDCESTVVLK